MTYRGHAWTAEFRGTATSDGLSRSRVEFTRKDNGAKAKGWLHGHVQDFNEGPVDVLVASLEAALRPKKLQRDWE